MGQKETKKIRIKTGIGIELREMGMIIGIGLPHFVEKISHNSNRDILPAVVFSIITIHNRIDWELIK
jgi:hypothetical protein